MTVRSVGVSASLAVVTAALAVSAPEFQPHVLVTTSDAVSGSLAAVDLEPPWSSTTGLTAIGAVTVARHWQGLHYIVNRSPVDDIQVIDPETWETIRRIPVGAGADPHDVVVVSDTKAYVSLHARRYLLIVDPSSGATVDSLDLSVFADPDGVPDMSRMETDGSFVYLQIQRLDLTGGGGTLPVAPSMIAVIDAVRDTIVDADPALPGTQAIALAGLYPVNDMYIEGTRLFLIEQGSTSLADADGGIDVVDLQTFRSLGFLTTEGRLGGHADGFVLVSPTKGYVVTHTDLMLSSHLTPFSRLDGSAGNEIFATYGAQTDQLAYDPVTDYLYFPANAFDDPGIRVFDATTDQMLTPVAVPTGLPPRDVLVVRDAAPGDVPPHHPGGPPAMVSRAPQPNPFRVSTEIRFILTRPAVVTAAVYDAIGRHRFSWRNLSLEAGEHTVLWSGEDPDGRAVPPGVYVVRLSTGGRTSVQRVVRLP